jgi:predicted metal-binding protein
MGSHAELEKLFEKHGFTDFKWIKPKDIVVAPWVRMKCMFGCANYGRNATCPPNVPSVAECREFFDDYTEGVLFHFEIAFEKPEDRHAWARQINLALMEVEKEVFWAGYEKTVSLYLGRCNFCSDCPGVREECRNPQIARPSPEAMGVDVFSTVRQCEYPIEVLTDYSQSMNRYTFLLIE